MDEFKGSIELKQKLLHILEYDFLTDAHFYWEMNSDYPDFRRMVVKSEGVNRILNLIVDAVKLG